MQAAVRTEILKQTEKAIQVDSLDGALWLPKSQVQIVETEIGTVVVMEAWLFRRHHRSFSWNNHGRKMFSWIDGIRPEAEIKELIRS